MTQPSSPRLDVAPVLLPLIVLAVLTAAAPGIVSAQDREPAAAIGSDRPGLGDAAHVVGTGVWQLEAGATLSTTAPGDREGVGSALVRYGFLPLELRIYLPSPIVSRGAAGSELGDLGVGVKAKLTDGGSWRWSLVGGATFPTGTDFATADDATGFATFIGETALTETVAFALNVGYQSAFESFGDGTFSLIATPSVPLADDLAFYAGYAGYFDSGDGPNAHFAEAGLALARDADTQWDLNTGWDIESESWFVGIGIAMRWR